MVTKLALPFSQIEVHGLQVTEQQNWILAFGSAEFALMSALLDQGGVQ
jgi:hypothetical protein